MSWDTEEWKARALNAREMLVPPTGESERVSMVEVMDRAVWFPVSGIYILRSPEGVVQFVGLTAAPLGERLRAVASGKKAWAQADYQEWTVTVQRAPDAYPADKQREWALIQELKPVWNAKMGRPRKAGPREAVA